MLREPVRLHDVADVERFVQKTINNSRLVLSSDERDDLVCEGLAIMHKLARDYRHHIEGHARNEGRFSGYAAMYLPRKLGDAWHKMHPEHLLKTDKGVGRRKWQYEERAASLDAVVWDADESRERRLPDALVVIESEDDMLVRLRAALNRRWEQRCEQIVRVGELLGLGSEPGDVAGELGLSLAQVREAMSEIALVADDLQGAT